MTLGRIDNIGKIRPGTSRAPERTTEIGVLTFKYTIGGHVARRTDPRGVTLDFHYGTCAGRTAGEPTLPVDQPSRAGSARRNSCGQSAAGATRPTLGTYGFTLDEMIFEVTVRAEPTIAPFHCAVRHLADTYRQEATRLPLSDESSMVTMPLVEDLGAPVGARFQDVRNSS